MITGTSLPDSACPTRIPGVLRAGFLAVFGFFVVSLSLRADASSATSAAGNRVNINQASVEQISYLPRIGAKVAARVVDYRKTHGQFARAEDLMEVKGIGEKLFLTLKPYIAVSGPTTLAAKVRLGASRKREAAPPATEKPPQKSAPASVPAGKGR
jgi:competence ComEA-like helix-hairpin-helix protein